MTSSIIHLSRKKEKNDPTVVGASCWLNRPKNTADDIEAEEATKSRPVYDAVAVAAAEDNHYHKKKKKLSTLPNKGMSSLLVVVVTVTVAVTVAFGGYWNQPGASHL
jgi:hypothetical protein